MESAFDLPKATGAIVQAVADGEIAPTTGEIFHGFLSVTSRQWKWLILSSGCKLWKGIRNTDKGRAETLRLVRQAIVGTPDTHSRHVIIKNNMKL